MDRKRLLKRILYLIFFILVANFIADKFYWYFSIWYFDMIMHFLGGFWLGLAYLYFFPLKTLSFNFSQSIYKILVFVFLVGLGWEVFELLFNNIIAQNPFNLLDTSSDIFFDLAGGVFAILYFLKTSMITEKNTV